MSETVYGLIEFDGSMTPRVIVGSSRAAVDRKAVQVISGLYGDQIRDEWGKNFITEFPYPDLADSEAVTRWFDDLREATTDPYYSLLTEYDVTIAKDDQ